MLTVAYRDCTDESESHNLGQSDILISASCCLWLGQDLEMEILGIYHPQCVAGYRDILHKL